MPFRLDTNYMIVLALFFGSLFFSNCEQLKNSKRTLKSSFKKQSNENLFSREETIELMKDFVGVYRNFDYTKELKLIYSRGIYSDSIFIIGYQPPYFKNNGGIWSKTDINSEEWLNVKNEIIKKYKRIGMIPCESDDELDIDIDFEIEYQPNKKIPYLKFYSASYEFLEAVSKLDGKITYIESSGGEIDMEAQRRKQNSRKK